MWNQICMFRSLQNCPKRSKVIGSKLLRLLNLISCKENCLDFQTVEIFRENKSYFPSVGGSDLILVRAEAASSKAQDTLEVNLLKTSWSLNCLASPANFPIPVVSKKASSLAWVSGSTWGKISSASKAAAPKKRKNLVKTRQIAEIFKISYLQRLLQNFYSEEIFG